MRLFPDDYIDSIYDIDFKALYDQGYRALLFDVDNTLVPHGAPANRRAKRFFAYLRECGIRSMALSNNRELRVKSFCDETGADGYIFLANKPSSRSYKEAMEWLGVTPEQTIFVGDQLFTDIWGAANAGVRSVLVRPVRKWKEEPQIILKRFLEAVILVAYRIKVAIAGVSDPVPKKTLN